MSRYAKIKDGEVVFVGLLPETYKGKNPLAYIPKFDGKGKMLKDDEGKLELMKDSNDYTIRNFNKAFTDDEYKLFGFFPVEEKHEKIVGFCRLSTPEFDVQDDKVVEIRVSEKMTDDEILDVVRLERDILLQATDAIACLPDYPITEAQKKELFDFRKKLRDLPDSAKPSQIVIPSKSEWM